MHFFLCFFFKTKIKIPFPTPKFKITNALNVNKSKEKENRCFSTKIKTSRYDVKIHIAGPQTCAKSSSKTKKNKKQKIEENLYKKIK